MFEGKTRIAWHVFSLTLVLVSSAIALMMVSPGTFHVGAILCNHDTGYWTPEPGATYAQTATTCTGSFQVSSSANVGTLVPQSGTYTFAACKIPSGQNAYCDQSRAVYFKSVDTGTGVFPNDSGSYTAQGVNSWYTTLDVTVMDTTTGNTNLVSSISCVTTLPGGCPV